MRWERPVSPRLQRRATIDPLSILCPSRGGSTSPERHLDSSSHCNSNQAASSSVGRLVTPRCIRRVVAGPGVLTELTLRRYHRYWSAARARLAGSRAAGVGSPALAGRLLAMAGRCAGAPAPLAGPQPSGLHWWLGRLRWRRITLAEVRILRFAICDELQIDLWQRAASPARLRHSPHDGRDAIHKKALAGPGTALHKSRLLASCPDFGAGPLAWGRLHGDSRTQTDTTKERAPDAVTTRSDWPPGPCYDPASHRPRH
jgi:hypothetical protein